MGARFRLGLKQQMLAGFIAGALLITVLLAVGDAMLRQTSARLVVTLEDNVRPLASLQRLQARVGRLRNLELELARLEDVFVVQAHGMRLESEVKALDKELGAFSRRLETTSSGDAGRLLRHWTDYRERLATQVRMARAMDLAGVQKVTSSGSYLPFSAIQQLLDEVSSRTEREAEHAYRDTVREQTDQRRALLLLVMLGSFGLTAGLVWSGRRVVLRIDALRKRAVELAEGRTTTAGAVSGDDEIGDLARAFDNMHEQVGARESALRTANNEMERRVAERTADLLAANRRMVLLSQAVEQNPAGILIADAAGHVGFVNPAYLRISGQDADAVLGRNLSEVIATDDAPAIDDAVRRARRGLEWGCERALPRFDGKPGWERLRLAPVFDDERVVTHLVLSREDISEQHAQQEKIAYQAHYDSLTGLPNRVLGMDRLVRATGRCRRDGGKAAAMFIDLDNFKQINDTLGHAAGDNLLRQASARLLETVRQDDTVARLGGDEFLVVVGGLARLDDTVDIAEKIIAVFGAPFILEDRQLVCTPSIGIAVFPDDGSDPMVLLRNADLAMYEAKEAGRNCYRFFNQSIHDASLRRLEVGRCLRGALERDELRVAYHPLVNALTGEVIGAEALMRWHSAELGNVPPDVFIPVAEQNGVIIDIGAWILREACATLARWRPRHEKFVMAVNVSPRQFRSAGFLDTVKQCLAEFSLPPKQLEIEITEGVLLHRQSDVAQVLAELRELGVRLSMDDFGTGYSSLSYLRQFTFDTIKIDRSFVRDLADDNSDRVLVVAAVRMAQAMGLRIVAEGVETDAQWSFLANEDCDTVQGFRFGPPIPEADFAPRWLGARIARARGGEAPPEGGR